MHKINKPFKIISILLAVLDLGLGGYLSYAWIKTFENVLYFTRTHLILFVVLISLNVLYCLALIVSLIVNKFKTVKTIKKYE